MKITKFKKTSGILISCLAFIASAFLGWLSCFLPLSLKTNADTLHATEYQTDGASVRVFTKLMDENGETEYIPTDRQGIRFHVEMGSGYSYHETPILDAGDKTTNKNGSYKMNEGFKTYTLVIPTRLLAVKGEMSVNTKNVLKIDTSNYWYSDADGNWESVAYVYNIPSARYTDNFSYCGVICTVDAEGNETPFSYTTVAERSVTFVAKAAYKDTIDENSNYWGSTEMDDKAETLLKEFIPTYTVSYNGGAAMEVLWGDMLNPPSHENAAHNGWYDTTGSEEVDVSKELTYSQDRTITLVSAKTADFVLSGAAAFDDGAIKGVKINATLPYEDFTDNTVMDIEAVNVEYEGSGTFGGIQSVTVQQEKGIDVWQNKLVFELDSSTLQNGDKLTIKGDSVFYANNVLYRLTKDYTIDFTTNGSTENYGMFLGYLYNSNVKAIDNAEETHTDGSVEYTVRITFDKDLLINGEFSIVNDNLPTEWEHAPIYMHCGDLDMVYPVETGRYYWNEGNDKILEFYGVFAHHNNDTLYGAEGTKLVQEGGYWIFAEEMHAYYNGEMWSFSEEVGTFDKAHFDGTCDNVVSEEADGSITKEVRVHTHTHWWSQHNQVSTVTIENLSEKPYAVYYTTPEGEIREITEMVYHGQAKDNGEHYHLLGFRGLIGETAGDKITIEKGARLWCGKEYYSCSESVTFYYNGSYWITAYDENDLGQLNAASFNGVSYNQEPNAIRLHFTSALTLFENKLDIPLTLGKGSVKVNGRPYTDLVYYYFDETTQFIGIQQGTQALPPIGTSVYQDTLVIEKGTRIWSGMQGYEFTEELKFRYINYVDENGTKMHWVLENNNVKVSSADIESVNNEPGINNNEIRLWLKDGILSTMGVTQMYVSTKTPILFNGEAVTTAYCHGAAYDLVSITNTMGVNDGDCFVIPAGCEWWTPSYGLITFTDEVAYTFIDGAWQKGNSSAMVNYTAENATVEGIERGVVGRTYTFTATAAENYVVSSVTVNGTALKLTDNNEYTFTAAATNEIVVIAEHGYRITIDVPDGVTLTIGGVEHTNETVVVPVAPNGTFTFTFTVEEGAIFEGVTGATKNSDGSYSVNNVQGDTEVVIQVTMMHKVNYSGNNVSITATANGSAVANGGMLENGSTVTFTVKANKGYMLTSVTGATKSGDHTYTVTVDGADVSLTAETIAVTDITDSISIENWADQNGSDNTYIILKPNANSYMTVASEMNGKYWNDQASAIKQYNYGVDIMDYIYINGVSARELVTRNANGGTSYTGQNFPFNVGGVYSPITVETTSDGAGLWMRVLKAFAESFEITVKAGFTVVGSDGTIYHVSEDVTRVYANGAMGSATNVVALSAKNAEVVGIEHSATIKFGQTYEFTVKANAGYRLNSVMIDGEEQGVDGTYSFTASNANVSVVVSTVKIYTVSATTKGGVSVNATSVQVDEGGSVTFTLTVPENATIKANGTVIEGTSYTVSNVTDDVTVAFTTWYEVTVTTDGATVNGVTAGLYESGTVINPTVSYSNNNRQSFTINGENHTSGAAYTISGKTEIKASSSGGCLVEGTLVTLADGSKKAVEDLKMGDQLLVFNHETGKYDVAALLVNTHATAEASVYTVINLYFSNGTVLRIADEHAVFDKTLNEYAYINEANACEFIGHEFVSTVYENGEWVSKTVTLDKVVFTNEYTRIFTPVSAWHINLVAEGMLTLSGSTVNFFEYDETMKYDEEKMQADIEKYGLYTYEDFVQYVPEEVFHAFPFKYFKVAIEKGEYTWEELMFLISEYNESDSEK